MGADSFAVVGSSGFIGRHVVARLREGRHDVLEAASPDFDFSDTDERHVIFCAGIGADFRRRRYDAMEAHVCLPNRILRRGAFKSFLYLSSARVYKRSTLATENVALAIDPADCDEVYNASKIAGEALALSESRSTVRVVRLSNVYGDDFNSGTFLSTLLNQAINTSALRLETSRESSKDYILIDDAVDAITKIAVRGRERLYNVASGDNVTNAELTDRISELTSCSVSFVSEAPKLIFPRIDISRLKEEFDFRPRPLLEMLAWLVRLYRESRST